MKPFFVKIIALLSLITIGASFGNCEWNDDESDSGLEKTVKVGETVISCENEEWKLRFDGVSYVKSLIINDEEYKYSGEGSGYILFAEMATTVPLTVFATDGLSVKFQCDRKYEYNGTICLESHNAEIEISDDLFKLLNGTDWDTVSDGDCKEICEFRKVYLPYDISESSMQFDRPSFIPKDEDYDAVEFVYENQFRMYVNNFLYMSMTGREIPVMLYAENKKLIKKEQLKLTIKGE